MIDVVQALAAGSPGNNGHASRGESTALVVELSASQDVAVVGGKAASLARAHAVGHAVPAGDRVAGLVRTHAAEVDALAVSEGAARTSSTWAELHRTCPALGAALAEVLRENRLRVLHYEPKHPTYGERPELLLGILDAAIAARHEPASETASATASAVLREAKALLDDKSAAELERLVAVARTCYASRDSNGVDSVSKPSGLLRWFVLELGRPIEHRIGAREHAVYLAPDEHARALRGELPDIRALIERRRGEESWALMNRGPRSFGAAAPPPMPPLDMFPSAMGRAMRIFAWMRERAAFVGYHRGSAAEGALTFIEPMLFGEAVFRGEALDADIGRPAKLGRERSGPPASKAASTKKQTSTASNSSTGPPSSDRAPALPQGSRGRPCPPREAARGRDRPRRY